MKPNNTLFMFIKAPILMKYGIRIENIGRKSLSRYKRYVIYRTADQKVYVGTNVPDTYIATGVKADSIQTRYVILTKPKKIIVL